VGVLSPLESPADQELCSRSKVGKRGGKVSMVYRKDHNLGRDGRIQTASPTRPNDGERAEKCEKKGSIRSAGGKGHEHVARDSD